MRILHVLDHSLPLHSGYAFRTAAILREQRALGWETLQLTTPRHPASGRAVEEVDGVDVSPHHDARRHRTQASGRHLSGRDGRDAPPADRARGSFQARRAARPFAGAQRIAGPRCGPADGMPVVYEMRAFWEDAAVDHGTTREGSARYRLSRALETYALRRVDHVTTICEGLRARDRRRAASPAERITVIPNAVDTPARSASAASPTRRCARALGPRRRDGDRLRRLVLRATRGWTCSIEALRCSRRGSPTCACCWSAAAAGSGA